jgi:hypothetical protein
LDPIKIDDSDLESSTFYKIAIEKLRSGGLESIAVNFKDSIFKEINGHFNNIIGKRSVVDEVSINFKAVSPGSKEGEPAYCLCGINEEKKENLSGTESDKMKAKGENQGITSIFCNYCCTWYHHECVGYRPPNKRDSKKVPKNDKGSEDFYACPKCLALHDMCDNPVKFMNKLEIDISRRAKLGRGGKNFIHQRLNHVLKRDFIQFNDYMIALRALTRNLDHLTLDNIRYWQKEMPFNIDYLRRKKFRSEKLEIVIIRKYQKAMVSVLKGHIDAFSDKPDVSKFQQIDFQGLSEEYQKEISRLYQDFNQRSDMDRNINFKNFIGDLREITNYFNFVHSGQFDRMYEMFVKMQKLGLLEGTKMKSLLNNAMTSTAMVLDKITKKFSEFRSRVTQLNIFELDKTEFRKLPTLKQIPYEQGSIEGTIIAGLVNTKGKAKKVESCTSLENLKTNFELALESIFFNDLENLENLKRYGEYYSVLTKWHLRYDHCRDKMTKM